jgi:hypothetical protein
MPTEDKTLSASAAANLEDRSDPVEIIVCRILPIQNGSRPGAAGIRGTGHHGPSHARQKIVGCAEGESTARSSPPPCYSAASLT